MTQSEGNAPSSTTVPQGMLTDFNEPQSWNEFLAIRATLGGIVTVLRFGFETNALWSIRVTPEPMTSLAIDVEAKAERPNARAPPPIRISPNEAHPATMRASTFVTEDGSSSSDNDKHSANAQAPMLSIVSGIVIRVSRRQPLNAYRLIALIGLPSISGGITIHPSVRSMRKSTLLSPLQRTREIRQPKRYLKSQ